MPVQSVVFVMERFFLPAKLIKHILCGIVPNIEILEQCSKILKFQFYV